MTKGQNFNPDALDQAAIEVEKRLLFRIERAEWRLAAIEKYLPGLVELLAAKSIAPLDIPKGVADAVVDENPAAVHVADPTI